MEKHKQYVNEWKSINDEVKTLADTIVNVMWYKSENDKPIMDRNLKIPFITGEFPLYMETVFNDGKNHFGIEKINVYYRIYFMDSIQQYNENYDNIGNSEYNSEENKIYIIDGLIEGNFNTSIVEQVYHELSHAFEYGMGMEKRADLYGKVSNVLKNGGSEVEKAMCKMVYYTFPHEQDAFAHQFYAILDSNDVDDSFDDLLYQFNSYVDFHRSIITYTKAVSNNDDAVRMALDYLGLSMEQFNKRYRFGKKRFERKLRNVYQRHIYELHQKRMTVEGKLKQEFISNEILSEYRKRYNNIEFEK